MWTWIEIKYELSPEFSYPVCKGKRVILEQDWEEERDTGFHSKGRWHPWVGQRLSFKGVETPTVSNPKKEFMLENEMEQDDKTYIWAWT